MRLNMTFGSRCTALAAFAAFGAAGCAMIAGGGGGGAAPPGAIVSSIPIQAGTILLAIAGDGSHVYAAANNGLNVIDTTSNRIVTALKTLPNPAGLTVLGNRGFLTNLFSLKLTVFDTDAQALLGSISLLGQGTRPAYGRVAVSKDGSMLYVVDQIGANLVTVGAAGEPEAQFYGLDLKPDDVALSPDGRSAYICGCKGFCTPGRVQRFDVMQNQFGAAFDVGPSPYRVAVSPNGATLYTANLGDGSVSIVDLASLSVTANVQVAPQLTALAISSDGDWIYTVSRASNQLAVIDAGENVVHTMATIGTEPREVVLSPDGRRAYVSTAGAVVVVDTQAFREG